MCVHSNVLMNNLEKIHIWKIGRAAEIGLKCIFFPKDVIYIKCQPKSLICMNDGKKVVKISYFKEDCLFESSRIFHSIRNSIPTFIGACSGSLNHILLKIIVMDWKKNNLKPVWSHRRSCSWRIWWQISCHPLASPSWSASRSGWSPFSMHLDHILLWHVVKYVDK